MSRANALLAEFETYLRSTRKDRTVREYLRIARRFLTFVNNEPLNRLSEKTVREFFTTHPNSDRHVASIVALFLKFAASRMPLPPSLPEPKRKDLALRQQWSLDKLVQQKNNDDDLIAKLARKLIDNYLYFQARLKGEPENLDDLSRMADECRAVIESNLALFMRLSAEGRNIHSKIDERVQQ